MFSVCLISFCLAFTSVFGLGAHPGNRESSPLRILKSVTSTETLAPGISHSRLPGVRTQSRVSLLGRGRIQPIELEKQPDFAASLNCRPGRGGEPRSLPTVPLPLFCIFLFCFEVFLPSFLEGARCSALWLFSPNSCVSGEQLGDASDSAKL